MDLRDAQSSGGEHAADEEKAQTPEEEPDRVPQSAVHDAVSDTKGQHEPEVQPVPKVAAPEYNRTGVDFRKPMPRPKVKGRVIDFHCHLLARRHAEDWFAAADHYGMDAFVTMTQLEEAVSI